jgi:hypothetical protein
MNSQQIVENNIFHDRSSFMIKNGRIAYQTLQKTWLEKLKHGLYLDDVLDSQLHLPSIRYDFKPYPSRSKKKKTDVKDAKILLTQLLFKKTVIIRKLFVQVVREISHTFIQI